jgi:hypothetical protein
MRQSNLTQYDKVTIVNYLKIDLIMPIHDGNQETASSTTSTADSGWILDPMGAAHAGCMAELNGQFQGFQIRDSNIDDDNGDSTAMLNISPCILTTMIMAMAVGNDHWRH